MRTELFKGPGASEWTFDVPTSRRERVRGLRDHQTLAPRHGLLFLRCRSVHTFGMTFEIAVVSLSDDLSVRSVGVMPPRRLLLPRPGTRHILECAAASAFRPGDRFVRGGLERGLSAAGGKPPATLRPSRR